MYLKPEGLPDDSIELKSDSLSIIRRPFFHRFFYAKVIGNPEKVTIKVYTHGKLLDSARFSVVRDVPKFKIRVKGERPGPCGYRMMGFPVSSVAVYDEDYGSSIHFKVLSFVGCMKRNGKVLFEEHFCGDQFTKSFNDKVLETYGDDVFWISSITVQDEENGNIYTKLDALRLPNN